MSKMRIPRSRSWLTESGTPWSPQSSRPVVDSPETNARLTFASRYTETSLCDPGQTYASFSVGFAGFETSHS